MMLVDCQTCPVRDVHCADCMVTALTRIPLPTLRPDEERSASESTLAPDPAERRAIAVLVAAGLVDRAEAERASARADRSTAGRARRAAG